MFTLKEIKDFFVVVLCTLLAFQIANINKELKTYKTNNEETIKQIKEIKTQQDNLMEDLESLKKELETLKKN